MLNNFILFRSKNNSDFSEFLPNKDLDTWHVIKNNGTVNALSTLNNYVFSPDDTVIGWDSTYVLSSLDSEDKKTILIGDPYKLYPDSNESLLEIIDHYDDDHKVHHKLGGAFAWIEICSNEGRIKINSDLFGQLPLFYYHDENKFAVATSIDLLLQSFPSLPRNVNMKQMLEFIVTGHASDGFITFFKYIHRLKGNQTLSHYPTDDIIAVDQYISLEDFRNSSLPFTPQNLKKDLQIAIDAATHREKAAFGLSGGIDSTLLAAIGADQSPHSISCYTAATELGQDLKFARIAASYMKADLHEVPMNYDAQKLDYIQEITRTFGQPIHIWGNTVGNPLLTQTARDNNCSVFINGSSEYVIPGGIFPANIKYFLYDSIKKHDWKLLFDTLSFNHKHKKLSIRDVIKEIFFSLFLVKNLQLTSKLKGRDFKDFFTPQIQSQRENLQTKRHFHKDYLHYMISYLSGGRIQNSISWAYLSGNMSNIRVRLPYLDSRLIKYIDNDRRSMLKNQYNKQFGRDTMIGIMDEKVIYREDDQGLQWSSSKLLKENKTKMIEEIQSSPFLKSILSDKTLRALEKPTFRKSLIRSLYSVALFDKVFHVEV